MSRKIGIIGAGNMANAMVCGMVSSGKFDPVDIKISNRSVEKLEDIREKYRIRVTGSNIKAAEFGDMIILAVKPDRIKQVLEEIKPVITLDKTVISIAAGITIDYMESILGDEKKIVRTMPNTPSVVGEGMCAISPNSNVSLEDLNHVQEIFHSFGKAEVLDEKLMDVVTAVSGSSPAIVYMFIEALADGAVLKGMSRDKAYRMVSQAVLGAAKMVRDTKVHPGQLKDNVTSAGGTAIEALYTLEKSSFRGIVMKSIERCTDKSALISRMNNTALKK